MRNRLVLYWYYAFMNDNAIVTRRYESQTHVEETSNIHSCGNYYNYCIQ